MERFPCDDCLTKACCRGILKQVTNIINFVVKIVFLITLVPGGKYV